MKTIRFLLGNELVELDSVDPTLTVLNYLRDERRKTGTKEGCAEGDCGACTVVLGELIDGELRYRAVNACILFLATLDGKQLLTVEDVAPEGKSIEGKSSEPGGLHPVQSAMVERHASQCGFCTPGFVMSGFAEYQRKCSGSSDRSCGGSCSDSGTDIRTHLDRVFAGNLCRCTGYGPIVDAGEDWLTAAGAASPVDPAGIKAALAEIQPDGIKNTDKGGRRYHQPATIEDMHALLAEYPKAVVLAGGTDVGLWVTKQHREIDDVIYLGNVTGLKEVTVASSELTIGAAVTYTEAMPALLAHFPVLEDYLYRHSSTQIRNSGTVVGNIANGSPIGDMPPVLMALDSEITLSSSQGRRRLPLADYFIDYGVQDRRPGEFIEAVHVPLPTQEPDALFNAYKISKRFDQDISAVAAAFRVVLDDDDTVIDASLCFGGMAATPKHASATERALIGRAWSQENVVAASEALAEDFTPLSDMRASKEYRLQVAKNLLIRFFVQSQAEAPAAQLSVSGGALHV